MSLVGILRQCVSCEEREETGNASEGPERDSCHSESSTYEHDCCVPSSRRLIGARVSKRVVLGAIFCTLVLLLPTVLNVHGNIYRQVSIENLPYEETFAGPDYVTIDVVDISQPEVLAIYFDKVGKYSSELTVDSESYGTIEEGDSIFVVPAMSNTSLEFYAFNLWMRIERVDWDRIVNNTIDNVTVKGKLYPEEYQRVEGPSLLGYRAMIAFSEGCSHTLEVDLVSGPELNYLVSRNGEITNFGKVTNQTATESIPFANFVKVASASQVKFKLEMEYWIGPDTVIKIPAFVDLEVSSSDIYFSDDTPEEGDTINITTVVHNTGELKAENFTVGVYLDYITDSSLIGETNISLNASKSTPLEDAPSFEWDTTGVYGTHLIHILLDKPNLVEEWNESNHAQRSIFVDDENVDEDSDSDGLPDYWESEYGLDPYSSSGDDGAQGDPDEDNLVNIREYENRTNPTDSDTDDDMFLDGNNNTFVRLKLENLTIDGNFDPPNGTDSYYIRMHRYVLDDENSFPYSGYRIPASGYFNPPNASVANLTISYIVEGIPLEVYHPNIADPIASFSLYINKSGLSSGSPTYFNLTNENVTLNVSANRVDFAFYDPDPTVEDADWDGVPDVWEIIYFDTRTMDCREMDSDSDQHPNVKDMDSDNDYATESMEIRLYYFPLYEEEAYNYSVYMYPVYEFDDENMTPKYRYPVFAIQGANLSESVRVNISNAVVQDTDNDGLLDGYEILDYFLIPTDPDTDDDGLTDGQEVNSWFFYRNESIGEYYFDRDSFYHLNMSEYYYINPASDLARYSFTVYGATETNQTSAEDIENALNITYYGFDETEDEVSQRIEYSADYDSGNLTANFTEINLTLSFNISTDGLPSVGLDIAANGTVMGHSSDLRLKLNYSVISVRGTIGWMNDTDWDGILDGEEVNCSLSPWSDDSDNDGIWDQAEIDYWHYEKGLSIQEARARANLTDYDGDGLFDGYEVMWSLDPTNEDPDGDDLSDYDEVLGFIPTKRMEIERSVLNDGNFSESFSALSSDRFSLKLLAKGYINRTKSQYDEDTIDVDYYVGVSNDLFMENNCNVSILLEGEPLDNVTFTTGGTISQRKEDNNSLNVTESRYFLVFGRLSSSSYDVHFEMSVTEDNASVNLSFHTLIVSREGLHPFEADFDHDLLNDGIEVSIGSSPFESDSDEDGLSDWDEYSGTYSGGAPTDPTNPDTDGDGVWDGYTNNGTTGELTLGTSALDVDTDDDGLWDGNTTGGHQGEQTLGTNATNPDTDGDTMLDGWEVTYGLPPTVDDGDNDTDEDGMSNAEEYAVGTDPSSPDTEGDNLTDKQEIYDVLYRTNVTDGAIRSDSYANLTGEKWIYCNITEWKTFAYSNETVQTESILTNDSWNEQNLRVHEDLVVWQDDRDGSWDIYAYNMSTENLTRISSSNSSEMIPDVWKNVVVWQDSRNDNTTGWDIYMFDLSTENETRITNSSDDETHPRVDSGWIVWLDDRHANPSNGWQKEVYAYNIENEQETRITEDEYDQSDLEMDSGRLVWIDESLGSPNVVLYHLGKTRYVTSDTKNKRNPDIGGNWIVWEQYDTDNWDIYALDLTRWFKTKVVSEEHDQVNPSVHGGIVVWEDKRNGNSDIYSMNLTTRFETRLTDDPETERRPVIFSSLYIWEEQNEGTWDVHFYNLEPVMDLKDHAPVRLNSESGDLYVWTQSNGFARFIESNTTGHVTSPMPEKGFRNKEIYSGSDPFGPDTDGDGLLDGENVTVGLNSSLFQFFDSLGIPYFEQENDTALFVGELSVGTDCLIEDTDEDGLYDGEEIFGVVFEIFRPNGTVEKKTIATIPTDSDFDDDGLIDGDEKIFRTDPEHPDTDLDSLIDGSNMTVENGSDLFNYLSQYVDNYIDEGDGNVTFVGEMSLGASPVSNESDGDGVLDEDEVFTHGTDPSLIDTDGDGMNDSFELHYDFKPLNSSDSDLDFDGDGSKNIHEFMYGTNPDDWDTDDDGLPDGWEQAFGMNALDNGTHVFVLLANWTYEADEGEGRTVNGPQGDLDKDGVTNVQEYAYMKPYGWNEDSDGLWWSNLIPSNPDTDSDGLIDGYEWFPQVYWYEAEDFVFSGDQIVNDTNASGGKVVVHKEGSLSIINGTSFSRCFDSGTYRLFAKARAVEKEDAMIEIFVDNPDESHRLLDGELQLLKTHYDWNGTGEFEVNQSSELRIWINDTVYFDKGEFVYVDQIMLVKIGILEETTTSDEDDIVEFEGQGNKTVYINLTLDSEIPLYVQKAWMKLEGWYGLDDIIKNGGFESELENWSTSGHPGDVGTTSETKKKGNKSAYIDPIPFLSAFLYQNVTILANATDIAVEWWDMKNHSNNFYNVSIRDEQGNWLETLFESEENTWSDWTYHNYALSSSYIGQTIQLCFMAEWNGTVEPAPLFIDEVKLNVSVPPYPQNATLRIGEAGNESTLLWQRIGPFSGEEATLDLSGEFNKYISLNLNSSIDYINIPLTFHSDSRGRIEIVELQVLLEPFVSSPFFNDTDSDNLTDSIEAESYTSSLKADSDNDGWTDHYEIHTVYNVTSGSTDQTSPVDSDTDDDVIIDSEDDNPTIADIDRDGLLDGIEKYLGTNASDPDTDDDALLDGQHITVETDSWRYNHFMNHSIHHVNNSDNTTTFFGEISFGTNPVSNDTDLDGLIDGDEITAQNSTDPLDPDTDNDFLLDGSNVTVESESDPRHDAFQKHYIIRIGNVYLGELSFETNQSSSDSDEDDLPDGWEVRFGLNPTDNSTLNSGRDGDPDNDELTNLEEFFYETHPQKWDTDGDSLPDVWEIRYGLDPLWNNTTRFILTQGWKYITLEETDSSQAGYGDSDQDQLIDIEEFWYNLSDPDSYNATVDGVYWNGTSPCNPDTDGDGIIDGLNHTMSKTDETFQRWVAGGILYIDNENGTVTFVGESSIGTDCLSSDTDGDNATDGQEVFGYLVVVFWHEDGELISEEKTVYGDPLKAHTESDGITLLDIDGDTIPDMDEVDPWNSTKYSFYVSHPDLNETDISDQFNPFIKENVPPRILNLKIKTEEKWEWIMVGPIPVYVCTHAWTEISVEVLEISNFTLEVRIDDYANRYATFEGVGNAWIEASLDLDYFTDVLLDYTVRISAEDVNGNALDPPLKKEVEGLFGGILKILSEFLDWISNIAEAIAKAIADAICFLVDWIVEMAISLVETALRAATSLLESWAKEVQGVVDHVFDDRPESVADQNPAQAISMITERIFGKEFVLLAGVATAISIVFTVVSIFLNVFSFLLLLLTGLLAGVIVSLIAGTDVSGDASEGISSSMTAIGILDFGGGWLELDETLKKVFFGITLTGLSIMIGGAGAASGPSGLISATGLIIAIFIVVFSALSADPTRSESERENSAAVSLYLSIGSLVVCLIGIAAGIAATSAGGIALGIIGSIVSSLGIWISTT